MSDVSELRDGLRREALRVYLRYAEEFVEHFNLCPWAERSRREGRVKIEVVLDDESPLDVVERFGADQNIEVGLIVMPLGSLADDDTSTLLDALRAGQTARAFKKAVARLRERHASTHNGTPPMALAAFHPDAEANLETGSRLVPYIRRSPDPTIQCVRLSVLAEMRRGTDQGTDYVDLSKVNLQELLAKKRRPPLHERVAAQNLEIFQEIGVERAEAVLADIHRDRDESYARLLARLAESHASGLGGHSLGEKNAG